MSTHVLLSAHRDDAALGDEVRRSWPGADVAIDRPGLLAVEYSKRDEGGLPPLAFSRQILPEAKRLVAPSVRAWADVLFGAVVGVLPDDRPWRLHVVPHYGAPNRDAGRQRCRLIGHSLIGQLKQRRRRLLRSLQDHEAPFTPADSLVQLLLISPEEGWLSLAPAPTPHVQRRLIWPFPKGEVPVASDPAPPSRAFAKLLEAQRRLGIFIGPGETCVDLGASPGSWSYVALERGASVTAVDRSPLRDDLMQNPSLRFVRGDAFSFEPADPPVDWLLCDVIAAPQRSIELALQWARRRWMRRFVVTVKFKGRDDYPQLDRLKAELPRLAAEWFVVRLSANKNEVCAFGVIADNP